ncbi:putative DNA-binding protein [Actinacidiphila reveromycinica]|uniref:Putative DNA-binding protein n=1 Tax=Actinacidiphila reveromycinica TaxID=659352 RepID=A0A7U3VLZ4_9ACTN|nr:helix-turn-helix domain-containing protein [Streptomyces sp. SN-593]BBA96050.1 putative DNA-binding protein [Streptomyces sp. SN-593]
MAQQQVRYCSCGTRLARDNRGTVCAVCLRQQQLDVVTQPPVVPSEFWQDGRLREALAGWHMGQVFYAYRVHPWHSRAVSQERLAGWLGLTQAQLSRIESAASAPQDLGKLMSWAHSLRIPGDLLWFKLPGDRPTEALEAPPAETAQSTGDILLPVVVNGRPVFVPVNPHAVALSGLGGLLAPSACEPDGASHMLSTTERDAMSPLDRRSLLKGGIAASLPGLRTADLPQVAAALQDSHRYFDGPVVAHFRTKLEAAKKQDGAKGPRDTLPLVLGVLGAVEEHARNVSPAVRRELLTVGADGAEFAGWLYRDIQRPDIAGLWYDRAMEWAQEADDPALQGYVLLKKAQMAYDDREALRMLTLSQAAGHARWKLPAKVLAEARQQEARGLAMLGEPMADVERRLEEAHRLLSRGVQSDEGQRQLSPHYSHTNLMLQTASCYIEAGQPARAADLYGDILASGTVSRRDTGYFMARRASSLALAGQPDDAASVGLASVEVATATNSLRTKRELGRVMHTLRPWATRPGPRALREALRA